MQADPRSIDPRDGQEPARAHWTASERESFFDAIARHRRAAWRVTLASSLANVLVALIVAILMSPIFYSVLGLLLDVINIIVPMPNLLGTIMDALGAWSDAPDSVTTAGWIRFLTLAAVPGIVWMVVVLFALRRALRLSATFDAGDLEARPPDPATLAEQQLANVIEEMSIAAGVPPPRVRVVERSLLNAAVFGRDDEHVTVVVSKGLLQRMDRAEMQGVAAHLVGSIANGDMAIGLRAAVTLSLFGFITYLGTVLVNSERAAARLLGLLRTTLLPTAAGARDLAASLADPFVHTDSPTRETTATPAARKAGPQSRWEKARPYLWLPLAGPLVISGFFGGIVSAYVLGPLLALTWRRRKYMADATAVRLTRDPNTLGEALEKMSAAGEGAAFAPWTAHLSVVPLGRGQANLLGGATVPMFPSLDRRLRALGKLGARLQRAPERMPRRMVLILTPLSVIVGILVAALLPLLIWLSLALTMLFTAIPVGIVHVLLRALGH